MTTERRLAAQVEAQRVLVAARAASNIKLEQVADALGVSVSLVDTMFYKNGNEQRHLKFADLFLLATDPETVAMARELVVPLNAIFDRERLTLQELNGLSRSPITVDVARMVLRPTLERLFPAVDVGDDGDGDDDDDETPPRSGAPAV